MADLWNYTVTRSGTVTAKVPQITLSGQFVENNEQTVVYDFTGANAIVFPTAVANLTADQLDQLTVLIADFLVHAVTGY